MLEAGSGKDALRIKVAELMLAAPEHRAIESTIKDGTEKSGAPKTTIANLPIGF